MNQKTNKTRELSYYDRDFIRTRADEAAETYEQERRNGHTPDQAQELAMSTLTKGLHYSQYDILLGVIDSEFEKSVPSLLHEQLAENLLPFMGKVFSIYDLTNDDFPLSDEYQNLHDELTGAVTLYLRQYGIQ